MATPPDPTPEMIMPASENRLCSWLECYKMQGSGNDFVLVDNRTLALPRASMPSWAKVICQRAFGVGADGLIFLDNPQPGQDVHYIWHFYNADGSRAEMCGNGSRCAARLAWELGLAPQDHFLGTDVGPIKATVLPDDGLVRVQLTPCDDVRLNLGLELHGRRLDAHFVNTGVPHAVVFVPEASAVDVAGLGRTIRNHDTFAPAGTNVDFVQVLDHDHLLLRTYERGVEGETLACGTGAAAAAIVSSLLGRTGQDVNVRTSGQEILGIALEEKRVYLTGKAVLVFIARLPLRSLGLGR